VKKKGRRKRIILFRMVPNDRKVVYTLDSLEFVEIS
jgi:hypothetical protein